MVAIAFCASSVEANRTNLQREAGVSIWWTGEGKEEKNPKRHAMKKRKKTKKQKNRQIFATDMPYRTFFFD
jgi:hypothetical protein